MSQVQAVSGVVDRAFTKTKSTRVGDKEINYIEVDGVVVSTGFKKLFSEGEMVNIAVKFNYGELQYQQGVDATGLPKATPVTKGNFGGAKMSNKGGGRGMGSFPIDPKDGQMSIIRQSSMDRAVTIVRDMVSCGTIVPPATQEEYLKLCVEIALNITDYASGNDIMQLSKAKAAMKEAING